MRRLYNPEHSPYLADGVKPVQTVMFGSSSKYDSGSNYTSNMDQLRKVVFESSEYNNEYTGTSEYDTDSRDAATRRQQHR